MGRGKRIIIFFVSLTLLAVIYFLTKKNFAALGDTPPIIIFSSLIMLAFVTLFLEHFFTRPTDVLASTIAILLLLAPLRTHLDKMGIWYNIFFFYNFLLFGTSITALLSYNSERSTTSLQNRISNQLKRFSTFFGNGRFLFFILFIITMLSYVDSQSKEFLIIFIFSSVLVLVDPKKFVLGFGLRKKDHVKNIGEIIGVQSKNIFLAKLHKDRLAVRRFDIVGFRYSMDDRNRIFSGLIVDNYLLNKEQWIKILSSTEINQALTDQCKLEECDANLVYKIEPEETPEILNNFVGIIIEKSKIDMIRFEYSYKVPISEGSLLEIHSNNTSILYQIVQGTTETVLLESKNEAGFIVGEAIQLGQWNKDRRKFEKYGWVPDINTPVFLAKNIDQPVLGDDELKLGAIPGTNYPITININDAVTHHLAILGVTGSGKSVFARNLIRNILGTGVKVICVDFTEEYESKFQDLNIQSIVNAQQQETLFGAIDRLSEELAKFPNQQKQSVIQDQQNILHDNFHAAMREFLTSEDRNISLFELPDVSNTTGILDYTKWFFKILFEIAKRENNFGKQICIVLEEAHTVIPEWNFIGVSEKQAQSLVNNIGQIALQGRKYNVGFLIIAQRTANVSKTVLTQCNSIVAFQQFDKTSGDFLSNYMGIEMVNALPTLKFRQAIAVGKAFRTGMPVIFEIPEIDE